MIHAVVIGVLIVYGVAALLYVIEAIRVTTYGTVWSKRLLLAGFAFHLMLTALLCWEGQGAFPATRGDYYLWIALALPAVFIALGKRVQFPLMGAFILPLTILFLVSSSYLVHLEKPYAMPLGVLFRVSHLVPAIVAEVSLLFAFVLSCIFLIQDRRLKRRSGRALTSRLPSLTSLDLLNGRFVLFGFGAMTFAILSGSLWALLNGYSLLRNDIYQVVGVVVWILLGLIHHYRFSQGKSARELARLTVLAASLLIISLLIFVFLGGSIQHGELYAS